MKILALEPYFGGSHKAFLDGWSARSQHEWEMIGLPAYKWKWRMRHAAITMADDVAARIGEGATWDALFCSDMLNLAELLGLVPEAVRRLPAVVYFHENQLTYPGAAETDRDLHFAFTNLTTALAADSVWFNSKYHRDSFLEALREFLSRMPDYQPVSAVDAIREKSYVQPPGIATFTPQSDRKPGPLRILWAARWESDKNPETFFSALELLQNAGVDFRLSVLGESFENAPAVFERARRLFSDRVDHWGFQPSHRAYSDTLCKSDVVVSTAIHEFFGIAVAEAVAAGAIPLVPRSLAYPELLGLDRDAEAVVFFHDGTAENVADKLADWEKVIVRNRDPGQFASLARRNIRQFDWRTRTPDLDAALNEVIQVKRSRSTGVYGR